MSLDDKNKPVYEAVLAALRQADAERRERVRILWSRIGVAFGVLIAVSTVCLFVYFGADSL